MIFLLVTAVLFLQSSNVQSINNDRNNNQNRDREFPVVLPEKGDNPNVQEKVIADAVYAFSKDTSIKLWQKQILGNVVFSPLSIQAILGLLLLGSRGVTHEQLKKALFFPDNVTDASIHESYQYVLGRLESGLSDVKVDQSSALFVQKGIPISGVYKQIAQALYDANVVELDFRNQPSISTSRVNRYVRTATGGKIPRVLKSSLSPNTLMIAINTILFNGPWQFPFNKDDTKLGIFDTGVRKKNVEMMHNIIRVPFIKRRDLGFHMVSLPYLNSDLSLYILTPVGNAGISSLINLESGLSLLSLDKLIEEMKTSTVDLTIPKIKLQFRHNFKSYLQDLGATAIFNPDRSNLGRMTPSTGFALQDVVHEAIFEITETGTIAAAATVTTINRLKPEHFRVDKPSLLFIRDNSNGVILFWARLVDP